MALSNYDGLARAVLLRCPGTSYLLARQWISFAFRQLAEKRAWSWLIREGQFLFPAAYTTGTAAVTNNSITVTGTLTVWTAAMVGRQFRAGANNPIYTIATRVSDTEITLDRVWGGATLTGQTYEIYRAYQTVPSDFHSFLTAVDQAQAWQLTTNVGQDELDLIDPQRTDSGQPWVLSFHDYDTVTSPPLPRYEAWPHVKSQYVIPFLYEIRPTDLEDTGAVLPRYARGDMLLEMALAECARWPGPDTARKNPYFNLGLADRHERRAQQMIAEAQRQDEEVFMSNVRYQSMLALPFAPSDAWRQTHEVY